MQRSWICTVSVSALPSNTFTTRCIQCLGMQCCWTSQETSSWPMSACKPPVSGEATAAPEHTVSIAHRHTSHSYLFWVHFQLLLGQRPHKASQQPIQPSEGTALTVARQRSVLFAWAVSERDHACPPSSCHRACRVALVCMPLCPCPSVHALLCMPLCASPHDTLMPSVCLSLQASRFQQST